MRARLEDQLINSTLVREVKNFADFKRENPQPDAFWGISAYDLSIYSARKFANVPFEWQQYGSGVYDIVDLDKQRSYKLAVYKDAWNCGRSCARTSVRRNPANASSRSPSSSSLLFAVLSLLMGLWRRRAS